MINYFLGGANGSGKSYFVERLVSRAPDMKAVHGSAALMEALGISPGDYTSLHKVPRAVAEQTYANIVLRRIEQNRASSRPKNLIFVSHYLDLIEGKIFKTITGNWLEHLDALICIMAPSSTIIHRLVSGHAAARSLFAENLSDQEKVKILDDFLERNLMECRLVAERFALPSLTIENRDGHADEAVQKFIDFHKSLARED